MCFSFFFLQSCFFFTSLPNWDLKGVFDLYEYHRFMVLNPANQGCGFECLGRIRILFYKAVGSGSSQKTKFENPSNIYIFSIYWQKIWEIVPPYNIKPKVITQVCCVFWMSGSIFISSKVSDPDPYHLCPRIHNLAAYSIISSQKLDYITGRKVRDVQLNAFSWFHLTL